MFITNTRMPKQTYNYQADKTVFFLNKNFKYLLLSTKL